MIIDESTYLEHYGQKGMKWGVRKQKHLVNRAKRAQKAANFNKRMAKVNPNAINDQAAKRSQVKADRFKRRAQGKETGADKAIRAVHGAVYVSAGALVVASIMSSHGKTPVNRIPKKPVSGVEATIRQAHAVKLSSLTRMHAEGKMDAAQFKNFSEALAARYDRKVVDALKVVL